MEINGVAHVFLTVADFARARTFYSKLLPFMGMKPVMDVPGSYYCVGGRTGLGIRELPDHVEPHRFDQGQVGLHHICFRARSREAVDEAHEFLKELGAHIVHGPEEAVWAPGYYSILFEDPDGIRLEINFVPGKGLLNEEAG
jgi:catechol 2,3-dioxygenase-like lactoylglutathione lyase family enzyme